MSLSAYPLHCTDFTIEELAAGRPVYRAITLTYRLYPV